MKKRQEKADNAVQVVQVKGVLQSVTLWGVLLALALQREVHGWRDD